MKFTFSSEARMVELVAKANKPLAKLNLAPVKVASVTPRKVKAYTETGKEYFYVVFDAEIELPEQITKIEGQEVVARLQHIEGLNLISRIGGFEGNLDAYREAPISCQHCNQKRFRKGSWVVVKDGKQIQIGDTCVSLYFGINVESILKTSYSVHSILDSDEYGSSAQRNYFGEFINHVVFLTSTKGFCTKKAADENGGVSTSAIAHKFCGECLSNSPYDRQEFDEFHADFAAWREKNYVGQNLAEVVLDWWMEKETPTEFEHNCKVSILAQDLRFQGLVAYATKMWYDAQRAALAPKVTAEKNESNWLGEVGEKLTLNLTVTNVRIIPGGYGDTTMITFMDDKGNVVLWYASSNPSVQVNEKVQIKGTVKKLDEFKGTKQTVLTRCSIF